MKLHTNATRSRRGAALVEYGLLVAGVAVVALAAVAILGGKVSGLFATSAAVLPGVTPADNTPIQAGQFVQTSAEGGVDLSAQQSLSENLGIDETNLTDIVITDPSTGGN